MVVLLAGCATTVPDDDEAIQAPPQAVGKADAAQYLGIYASHLTHHANGDVPDLELRSDGNYVRQRCYRSSCSLETPETGRFDEYTSSTGHTYVRFYGQQISLDQNNNIQNQEIVADVYEIRAFTKGVQLRRAHSTRWQSLYLSSAGLACATSGGTYTGTDCTCPANEPMMPIQQVFVPGAGGCIANPGASESNCDDSQGMWTDDDATLIGSYCICAVGEYLDSTGSCSSI
ncbi:MAG: hypothetical protein JO257_20390 [Deltaproteobacteria bacterium]|nr:hypothetical protein [Deltaproteobacteria bacterium]